MENFESKVFFGGIGAAICDSRDELLFEMRKPFYGRIANEFSLRHYRRVECCYHVGFEKGRRMRVLVHLAVLFSLVF